MEPADEADFLQGWEGKGKWTAEESFGVEIGTFVREMHNMPVFHCHRTRASLVSLGALGHVSFPGGCLTQPFSWSKALVLPCFNTHTRLQQGESGLIPAAELQQPKHPSVLSTVILSCIWTRISQTKASISHYHDLCQPGLPLNLFPLNLQGRKEQERRTLFYYIFSNKMSVLSLDGTSPIYTRWIWPSRGRTSGNDN